MITVWGEGRGVRVVWLLEEMGLPYRLRGVDLLKGAANDAEFMAINPCGYIPALQDGAMVMVESIAIMEYLIARYGQGGAGRAASPATAAASLAPAADDPAYGRYQQFLHLGEAGLAMPVYMHVITKNIAPEPDRNNWTDREAVAIFQNRLQLVTAQLARAPFMAGEHFTAADISVAWSLNFARRSGGLTLGEPEHDYLTRCTSRPAFARVLETCPAYKAYYARPDA